MIKTIIDLFNDSVQKYHDKTFLWEKLTDKFTPTTYAETKKLVYELASGLLELGVQKEDKIALLSEGRNEWIIGELGILHVGAINVPLSIKLEESNDLLFRLIHSETKYIIVSGGQSKKIRNIINDLPAIKKVIIMDIEDDLSDREVSYTEICKIGANNIKENRARVEQISNNIAESDLANICYTSGTTADPKGVMLTHNNYACNVEQVMSILSVEPGDSNLIILPLDHCFAHVAGFYSFMAYGANVATVQRGNSPAEMLRNIPQNIKEFQPSVILSVPALAKNFRKNIEANIKLKGDFTYKLFNHALKTAYAYNREGYNKKNNVFTKLVLKIYDKIFFSKIREAFGGKMKFFTGGGALLDTELQRFFYAVGMPMLQGYGLSEATPVISANTLDKHKLGTSGILVKPMDIKICDEEGNEVPFGEKGEIVIRGGNVMLGYWKNEEATKKAIKDGWLFTGDMGYVDTDGFIYVLGRFKSLLIGGDGEKYAPEGIEEAMVEKSPFIEQMILYNSQNPYTVALLVPNKANLKEAVLKKHPHIDWENREAKEEALMLIQAEADKYKSNGEFAGEFPERWLPAAIAVLPEAFTEQNHMVNSTMKIVRGKVETHYQDRIDYLFTSDGKKIINDLNINSL